MTGKGAIYKSVLVFVLLAATALTSSAATLDQAEELYQRTAYRQALRLLDDSSDPSPAVDALIGKVYYRLGDYKKATSALESAIEADPNNSEYYDWLGKIYGKRAETSSFLTAWSYAGKCHKNFEKAIALDPGNIEAIDDLFEFSLNAPGFVGGGVEKAVKVAEMARHLNPAKYESFQARLAKKRKDFASEEQHLRAAMELDPANVGRIADLARFLARHGRFQESETLFERARQIAPHDAQLKFERAKTYIELGRNRETARKLLKEYLASALTPDDPPRSEAERLLRKARG